MLSNDLNCSTGASFQQFWKSNYLWRYSPQDPSFMENLWPIYLSKMLPSEQGINILSCPQNQSCALLNSDLPTINIPFALVNGISNPLCRNLAEFAAPLQKLIKISQVVLSVISDIFFPMLFLFKNANLRYIKTIHCKGFWHNVFLFLYICIYICMHTYIHTHVYIYIYMYIQHSYYRSACVGPGNILSIREDYRWSSAPF